MKKSNFQGPYLLFALCLLIGTCLTINVQARDPKVDEMPPIEEIAGYLRDTTRELYSSVAYQTQGDSRFEKILDSLERLNEKADQFYYRTTSDAKAPWRSTSAYKELNQAFVGAQDAFIARPTYLIDPRAFEDIAYLMGALLQYYQEPVYTYYGPGTVYSQPGYPAYPSYPVYPVYPRMFYPWLPSFYVYSNSRFANPRIYPWSRFVIFGTIRR